MQRAKNRTADAKEDNFIFSKSVFLTQVANILKVQLKGKIFCIKNIFIAMVYFVPLSLSLCLAHHYITVMIWPEPTKYIYNIYMCIHFELLNYFHFNLFLCYLVTILILWLKIYFDSSINSFMLLKNIRPGICNKRNQPSSSKFSFSPFSFSLSICTYMCAHVYVFIYTFTYIYKMK